jgi:hypothetical protein
MTLPEKVRLALGHPCQLLSRIHHFASAPGPALALGVALRFPELNRVLWVVGQKREHRTRGLWPRHYSV